MNVCKSELNHKAMPSYIAVISFISSEPIYFMKLVKKGRSNQELKDRYRNVVS